MMQRLALVVSLVLAGTVAGADLWACGEKFFIPGRTLHIARSPAERGAAGVLVLATPGTMLATTLGRTNVEASLRKAGYAPRRVAALADLDPVLPLRRWDVLVVDLAEAAAARTRVGQANPSVLVLPVAEKPSAIQLAQARREFPLVLKTSGRAQDFLDALDDALSLAGRRQ
jgi:hypothetical protein